MLTMIRYLFAQTIFSYSFSVFCENKKRSLCKLFNVSCDIFHAILLTFVSDFWTVYGECENFAMLKGHTGAIMELQFSTDGR